MARGGQVWSEALHRDLRLALIGDSDDVERVGMEIFARDLLDVRACHRRDQLGIAFRVIEAEPIQFDLEHEAGKLALTVDLEGEAADQVALRRTDFSVADRTVLNLAHLLEHQFQRLVRAPILGLEIDQESAREFRGLEAARDPVGEAALAAYYFHQAGREAAATQD